VQRQPPNTSIHESARAGKIPLARVWCNDEVIHLKMRG
jgi:hypothetical protein